MVPDFEESLRIASNKHDIAALKIFDPVEKALPDLGLIRVTDSESGIERWIDTSSRNTRAEYQNWWANHIYMIQNIFRRCGVDTAEISTDEDYVKPLIMLFKKR